jgi:lipoyl-dependent peroxiredoxin subunit D
MSIQALRDRLPEYARDLRLNLSSLAAETVLDDEKKAGTFIASAIASRNAQVIRAALAELGPKMSAEGLKAAQAAAAIMAMNNVYYRFTHLVEADDYAKLPAKLRMNVMANPGVARENFELWSLAVSAVNGCGKCLVAHERVLRQAGLAAEQVQAAVRIAAVVHAAAVTLEAEEAVAGEPLAVAG